MSFGLKRSLTDVSLRSAGHAQSLNLVSSWPLETVALRLKTDEPILVYWSSQQTVQQRPKWDSLILLQTFIGRKETVMGPSL